MRKRICTWIAALWLLAGASPAAAAQLHTRTLLLRQPPDSVYGREVWRAWVNEEQAPVLAALESLEESGQVASYKTHWLINSVRVTGTEDAFEQLAALPQIIGRDDADALPLAGLPPPPPEPRVMLRDSTGGDDEYFQIRDSFAYEAWDKYNLRGQGMIIGMVDSGIDPDHPDLAGKIAGFKVFNEFGEDEGLEPGDDYPTILNGSGHGTSVAGILVGGNSSGRYIGVAHEARILVSSFNVHSTVQPDKAFPSREALVTSHEWLADPDGDPATDDGARVISGSWGSLQSDAYIPYAKALHQNGVVLVNANGNSGPGYETTVSPANIPEYVIGVGAGGPGSERGLLNIKSYSSRGPAKWHSDEFKGSYIKPDISAPSGDNYTSEAGGGYTYFGGTSAATPVVAATCLLLLQANPDLTPAQIMQILRDTANVDDATSAFLEVPNNVMGYGFLDAGRAAALVVEPGTVSATLDIGVAANARARIRGTGFVRSVASGQTLEFQYAPGDYTLEVIAEDLTVKTFDFTVTAGQTTAITGAVDGAAADNGLAVTIRSSGMTPWFVIADGQAQARVDVRLMKQVSFTDGTATRYRTAPAAGLQARLRLDSGAVTVSQSTATLDADGAAAFDITAGTTPGHASMTLLWIDPATAEEHEIESFRLNLLPRRYAPPRISNVAHSPENTPADIPVWVSADIVSDSGADLTPLLHYSTDGGATFATVTMARALGDSWNGRIPGQPSGGAVSYFVSVADSHGNFTTESAGVVRDWTNTAAFKQDLSFVPSDEIGEPLYNQFPIEESITLLADPLPERRDIHGPLGAAHDFEYFYFLLKLKFVFEAADDMMNPKNAFAYGVMFWGDALDEWEVSALYLPGANAVADLNLNPLGLVTPYTSYETDRGVALDFGDGSDMIFRVERERLLPRMQDGSLVFSFGSVAANIERLTTVEMDTTALYRYYPREHFYSVPGGETATALEAGWNLASAGVLRASTNPADLTADNNHIWGVGAGARPVHKSDPEFASTEPENAVWIYSNAAQQAAALSSGAAVDIPLEQGWNAFSNPFAVELDWDGAARFTDPATIEQKTFSEAAAAGWVQGRPWHYFQGAFTQLGQGAVLSPARGYAVKANRPLVLRLEN